MDIFLRIHILFKSSRFYAYSPNGNNCKNSLRNSSKFRPKIFRGQAIATMKGISAQPRNGT